MFCFLNFLFGQFTKSTETQWLSLYWSYILQVSWMHLLILTIFMESLGFLHIGSSHLIWVQIGLHLPFLSGRLFLLICLNAPGGTQTRGASQAKEAKDSNQQSPPSLPAWCLYDRAGAHHLLHTSQEPRRENRLGQRPGGV